MFNFKSMMAYQYKNADEIKNAADDVEQAFANQAYAPLDSGQLSYISFYPVNGVDNEYPKYLHRIEKRGQLAGVVFTVNYAKRNIPSAILKKEFNKRVKEFEKRKNAKLTKDEKADIKEQVVNELAKHAFPVEKNTDIMVDFEKNQVYINTKSTSTAENAFALVRKMLGSFGITPLIYPETIQYKLDEVFIKGYADLDSKFTVGEKFKLTEPEEQNKFVTNSLTEYTLSFLKELVQDNALSTNQLTLTNSQLEYTIQAPKVLENGVVTYVNVVPDFHDVLSEHLEGTENDDKVAIEIETRNFLTEQWLEINQKLTRSSEMLFGTPNK